MDHRQEILQILKTINAAIANARLYSFDHPQVDRYIQEAYIELERLLQMLEEITLIVVGDNLVFRNQTLKGGGPVVHQFLAVLKEKKVDRLTFLTGLPRPILAELIRDISSPKTESLQSSAFIKLGKVQIRVDDELDASDENAETIDKLISLRDSTLGEIRELYSAIQQQRKNIDFRGVEKLISSFIKGVATSVNPLNMLATLKSNNEYTFTHVINVCILTMSQAESLGFTGDTLYKIGIASVVHDAGKLFIPNEIIDKPGALTAEERAIIETHTTKGARYILGLKNAPQVAVLGALEHHIKFDGTGYPFLQKKWDPNIVSQMIAIADVFDAMRSRRSYKEPKPQEFIIQMLQKEKGTAFNPILVDHFIKLIKG